ncbi:hypothetical protein K438DRAFT_1936627 [Mycena galopus ATCC 62051]|nr:hypothetical protein K438DRAFT_1936627 [Mycena galopus ATCC 62051]
MATRFDDSPTTTPLASSTSISTTASRHAPPNLAAIVAGTVSGIGVVALSLLAFVWLKRRKRRQGGAWPQRLAKCPCLDGSVPGNRRRAGAESNAPELSNRRRDALITSIYADEPNTTTSDKKSRQVMRLASAEASSGAAEGVDGREGKPVGT